MVSGPGLSLQGSAYLYNIEMDLASWARDSFDSIKQAFFLPSMLLPDPASRVSLRPPLPKWEELFKRPPMKAVQSDVWMAKARLYPQL